MRRLHVIFSALITTWFGISCTRSAPRDEPDAEAIVQGGLAESLDRVLAQSADSGFCGSVLIAMDGRIVPSSRPAPLPIAGWRALRRRVVLPALGSREGLTPAARSWRETDSYGAGLQVLADDPTTLVIAGNNTYVAIPTKNRQAQATRIAISQLSAAWSALTRSTTRSRGSTRTGSAGAVCWVTRVTACMGAALPGLWRPPRPSRLDPEPSGNAPVDARDASKSTQKARRRCHRAVPPTYQDCKKNELAGSVGRGWARGRWRAERVAFLRAPAGQGTARAGAGRRRSRNA